VIVHLSLDCDQRRLRHEPEIITKGFVFVRDSDELLAEAREKVKSIVHDNSDGNLDERIERELSKFFFSETRRRPMIFVFSAVEDA
jgi:ribonuclease J